MEFGPATRILPNSSPSTKCVGVSKRSASTVAFPGRRHPLCSQRPPPTAFASRRHSPPLHRKAPSPTIDVQSDLSPTTLAGTVSVALSLFPATATHGVRQPSSLTTVVPLVTAPPIFTYMYCAPPVSTVSYLNEDGGGCKRRTRCCRDFGKLF
ncbi:hypothetical protein RIF29_22231 [Crotalaria pallida]|uniref:Uncharacterized protein n=1 Tax=Crotalaria pallida TaxID=3830 RepID=A0AAN9IA71_CROPI